MPAWDVNASGIFDKLPLRTLPGMLTLKNKELINILKTKQKQTLLVGKVKHDHRNLSCTLYEEHCHFKIM